MPEPDFRTERGKYVAWWIEEYCRIPEGVDVGQRVRLRPWQRELLEQIYDNPVGTRRAIFSVGRKNAKTALAAFLLLMHLCSKMSRINSNLYSAAQSKDQASILFGLAAKCVRLSPILAQAIHVRDHRKELHCEGRGTRYQALSAEVSTSFGLNPCFVVHDELGQVRGPRSELYEALESATGAQTDPLSLVISTQAPHDQDLFSQLIDDAIAGHDPHTVIKLYTAPKELDPFSDEAIMAANPAFGDFQNAAEVRAMAASAKRMSASEAGYRNLVLNQRVAAEKRFVDPAVWAACGADPVAIDEVSVYGGLDLSAAGDLTACVLIGQVDNVWQVHPTFWLPADGLAERAKRDRVVYDLWASQGYLQTAPGKSVDYEYVAIWLREQFDRYDIQKLGFDRWNFHNLRPWLLRNGFDEETIEQRFVQFGQGWQSMSPALRELEAIILNGRLAHGMHPVLAMCADNAVVVGDPAGNRKLNKQKSFRRIDGMVALTMAFGVANEPVEEEPSYEVFVLD